METKKKIEAKPKKAVDPLYTVRCLQDDYFVKQYSSKYGTPRKFFLPIVNSKITYDSHSMIGRVDRVRINKILDRNLKLYQTQAIIGLEQLQDRRQNRTQQLET